MLFYKLTWIAVDNTIDAAVVVFSTILNCNFFPDNRKFFDVASPGKSVVIQVAEVLHQ